LLSRCTHHTQAKTHRRPQTGTGAGIIMGWWICQFTSSTCWQQWMHFI